jgi:hypothetical protein
VDLQFRFFNGSEAEAVNRLRTLNRSVSVSVQYAFFLDSTGSPIHNPTDIHGWMLGDPKKNETVVALLHYTKINDVATRAASWNRDRRERAFVLLFTGGATNEGMREASKKLNGCGVGGAWALEKGFSTLMQNEAWKNLHNELSIATSIGEVRAAFEKMIPAINETEVVVMNEPRSLPAENAAEADQPKEVPPKVQLGIALEILLEAAQLAQVNGAAANCSLTEKLKDRRWWKRQLRGFGKDELKEEWRQYVQKYRINVSWEPVDAFLDEVFSDTGRGLLDAARAAHRALERDTT